MTYSSCLWTRTVWVRGVEQPGMGFIGKVLIKMDSKIDFHHFGQLQLKSHQVNRCHD